MRITVAWNATSRRRATESTKPRPPQAREEGLWVFFYLVAQEEFLYASMEWSCQRLEVFQATCTDLEPSDANDVTYEVLITEIAGYLGH